MMEPTLILFVRQRVRVSNGIGQLDIEYPVRALLGGVKDEKRFRPMTTP